MLFKISLDTSTHFIRSFSFDAQASKIIILDNELSGVSIPLKVSRHEPVLLSKMFNTMTHQLMEEAIETNKGYVYINLRTFLENYEAALKDTPVRHMRKRKVYEF
nr:MAG TPA: hypothetical protein [Caudoviricetes sp.]